MIYVLLIWIQNQLNPNKIIFEKYNLNETRISFVYKKKKKRIKNQEIKKEIEGRVQIIDLKRDNCRLVIGY